MSRLNTLASAFVKPAVEQAVRRAAFKGAFGLFGLMFIMIGLVALSAAGYLALRAVLSPLEAALVAAGVFFLLGGICLVIAGGGKGSSPPPSERRAGDIPSGGDPLMNALLAGQLRSEDFEAMVRKNAKSLAFGALIAGVAFGSSPELQKALADRIRNEGK